MSTSQPTAAAGPTLTEEFVYRAELSAPVDIGTGPFGTRMFFPVSGGRVEGPRISAEVLAGGGDWALIGPDGFARVDVRGQFRTDDGAAIYVQYSGLIEMNETVGTALGTGGATEYPDQYFRITPRFETGDARYAWLHTQVFVGQGRVANGAVEYTVYRVN